MDDSEELRSCPNDVDRPNYVGDGGTYELRVGNAGVSAPVFISYARRESAPAAIALAQSLEPHAFLDTTDIESGHPIAAGVVDALLAARVVVVFAGPVYFTRWYCLRELDVALSVFNSLIDGAASSAQRAAALEPVVVALSPGGVDLDRLPPLLRGTNWPAAGDTDELAQLVARRLESVTVTLESRLVTLDQLEAVRSTTLDEADLPPARSPGDAPYFALPGEVPISIGRAFVGRADELWRIHHELFTLRGDASAAGLTVAIEGGAGTGKTRLAAEYFHRFGHNYPGGLFWVDAESADNVDDQLHGILATLVAGTPGIQAMRDVGRDIAAELAAALRKPTAPVLYVVDNVPEPEPGQAPPPLTTWCPAMGAVALLVTSRAQQSVTAGVRSLRAEPLPPDAAVRMLTRDASVQDRASDGLHRIAEWVGHLPLALELLNASLRTGALGVAELLALAEGHSPTAALDASAAALAGVVPAGQLGGISAALSVSYRKLPTPAQETARLLALLAPAPVPLDLLEALGPEASGSPVRVTLITRSFVTRPVESSSVAIFGTMHRVLASFLQAQSPDPDAELTAVCEAMLALLTSDASRDPTHWPLITACLPHAELLFTRVQTAPARVAVDAGAALGRELGFALLAQGRTEQARLVAEAAVDLASAIWGADRRETLGAADNLATVRRALGDLEGARALHEDVLERARRHLGPEDADTLTSADNLADTLRELGEFTRARDLHQFVRGVRLRRLGREDVETLASTEGLALDLEQMGELATARELFEEVLDVRLRQLGPEHPDTLVARNNLASLLVHSGDLTGARAVNEAVHEVSQRVLGAEHPDTLRARSNLAESLRALGELERARELHKGALEIRRRVLGPEHPDTLASTSNLALALWELGEFAEARTLQTVVLESFRRVLGSEHPHTLMSANNLAMTHLALEDAGAARDLLQEALDTSRRVLGPKHPDTSLTAFNLTLALHATEELERREVIIDRDLAWIVSADPMALIGYQRMIREMLQPSGPDSDGPD